MVIYILDSALITGTELESASAEADPNGDGWSVAVSFKADSYNTWSNWTATHTGTMSAFEYAGTVLVAPRISGPITTPQMVISGGLTEQGAVELAAKIRRAVLPVAFVVVDARTLN